LRCFAATSAPAASNIGNVSRSPFHPIRSRSITSSETARSSRSHRSGSGSASSRLAHPANSASEGSPASFPAASVRRPEEGNILTKGRGSSKSWNAVAVVSSFAASARR
jgi:hypothetical protein